jgi:hypothetical protein
VGVTRVRLLLRLHQRGGWATVSELRSIGSPLVIGVTSRSSPASLALEALMRSIGTSRRRRLLALTALLPAFGVVAARTATAGHEPDETGNVPLHLGALNDTDANSDPADSGINASTRLVGRPGGGPVLFISHVSTSGGTAIQARAAHSSSDGFAGGAGLFVEGGNHTSLGGDFADDGGHGVRAIGGNTNGFHPSAFAGDGVRGSGGVCSTGVARHGAGVRGIGSGSPGSQGPGVVGETNGSVHPAVMGLNDGAGYGVFGQSATAVGIRGVSFGAASAGVEGVASGNGPGVWGFTTSGHAVLGNSASGNGGVFASQTGYGASISTVSGAVGVFAKGAAFAFQGEGSLTVTGTGHFAGGIVVAARVADGSLRATSAVTSPEALVEDVGRARLAGGSARVELDATFRQMVSTSDFAVFLTPMGDCKGLYVAGKSATGFEVHELQAGTSTLDFDYRVVAKRTGAAAIARFARVDEPPAPPTSPPMPTLPRIQGTQSTRDSAAPRASNRPNREGDRATTPPAPRR